MVIVYKDGGVFATHEDWQSVDFDLYPQADEIRFADGRVLINSATQPAVWRQAQAARYTHNGRVITHEKINFNEPEILSGMEVLL